MLPFQERLMLLATRALAALPVDMAQEQLAELLTHAYSGGKLGSSRRPKHRLAGGKADCVRLCACVPARARVDATTVDTVRLPATAASGSGKR